MPDQDGDKTEDATPKRKREALEKGNVPKSREVSTAVVLSVALLVMYFYLPSIIGQMQEFFTELFMISRFTLTEQSLYALLREANRFMMRILLPVMGLLLAAGIMSNVFQFGFIYTPKALEPKWERLDPIKGFGNLFSKRSLMELVKSIFKIFVIGTIAYVTVKNRIPDIIQLADAEPIMTLKFLGSIVFEVALKATIAIIIMALIDLLYQRWQNSEDMKMTKQEVKEEYKQMEGDPLIKQRIRSMQREMARKRMMEDVPKSDVVVTNPTHFAVAIRYEQGNRAPMVVAKGQRLQALRIREMAKEHGVMIYEDPPLAQTLFKTVDIGEEIPENLYKAIAEVLAFVYKTKNRNI